jgi:hypothetical protein
MAKNYQYPSPHAATTCVSLPKQSSFTVMMNWLLTGSLNSHFRRRSEPARTPADQSKQGGDNQGLLDIVGLVRGMS